MTYQQIDCVDNADDTMDKPTNRLTVWVEADRVKVGNTVKFKETGNMAWVVATVYHTRVEGVNRGWGLDLPKSQRTER